VRRAPSPSSTGTLAAALGIGLRLWIAGSSFGSSATWRRLGAKRDPDFRRGRTDDTCVSPVTSTREFFHDET